jgi:hypothetical protein
MDSRPTGSRTAIPAAKLQSGRRSDRYNRNIRQAPCNRDVTRELHYFLPPARNGEIEINAQMYRRDIPLETGVELSLIERRLGRLRKDH